MTNEILQLERHGKAGLIHPNPPQALNAPSLELRDELHMVLVELERDSEIATVAMTRNDKAFAGGADIETIAGWDCVKSSAGAQPRGAREQLQAVGSSRLPQFRNK